VADWRGAGRLLDQVIVDLRRDGVTAVEDVLTADEVGEDLEAPPDPTTWLRLRATWVLTPFTVETGTLRYIPGSHLAGPPTEYGIGMPPHPDEVRVVAAPGATVLKSAHVWHSGTYNASAEPRLSMDVDDRACEAVPSAC
jgi:hypothetical protein